MVAAVALAMTLVGGVTAIRASASAGVSRKQLLALGDSVAAGHGLGPDGNSSAYPALIGAQTGYEVDNYAVSGACVASKFETAPFAIDDGTPTDCPRSGNVVDQLQRAEADHAAPSIITLTVGANDLRFVGCFESATGFGSGGDQCARSPDFETRQTALAHNLAGLLTAIDRHYPSARVILTQYYNPLPPPAASGHACRAFYYAAAANGLVDTVEKYATGHMDAAAGEYQRSMYEQAAAFVAGLNQSIQVAADTHHAQAVALDFTGHDLCGEYENYTPWIFAPTASATLSVGGRLLTHEATQTYTFSLTAKDTCTCDPSKPGGTIAPKDWSLSSGLGALDVSLHDVHWDANGTPHPNAAGQSAIASRVLALITQVS
jgi:lysophospholipase L1-like esterase